MLNHSPTCPQCRLADKAYKVSLLYLESSARLQHNEHDHQPELDGLLADQCVDPASPDEIKRALAWLNQSFAPPEGESDTHQGRPRSVSPDVVVAGFAVVALALIALIAARQTENLPSAVIILSAALLIYLISRRAIMQHYRARINRAQESQQRIEEATSRWMRLYYCSRDQGVFDPEQDRLVSVEQIQQLLYEA